MVGLDVGTTKVCAVIAQPNAAHGIDVVGVGGAASRGLRKGVVVNIEATVDAIRKAVTEAEQMAGVEASGVYAGVAGGHIRGINNRGAVTVSGKDREVTAADVQRAVEVARAVSLPQDREILHVLPQAFVVDDQDGIRAPVGMSGSRLEVEVHIVTGAASAIHNVIRSVNRAGLTVHDVVLEPLASAEAVLSPDEMELGVVLVDIGGGTTDLVFFRDGAVWHSAILPLGGDHVTNDIAVGLRAPVGDAEELKRRYGCALTALVSAEETIDVPSIGGRRPRQLSRQVLSGIIQPRMEEIISLAAREMVKLGFQGAATAGVVVTGGTSIMEGVPELTEAIFELPVRRGLPETVGGLADVVKSPIYATGVGLALYGVRTGPPAGVNEAPSDGSEGGLGGLARRFMDWFGEIF